MIRPEFIEMLRCPETRTRLVSADADLLARVNEQIATGGLKNRAGQTLDSPLHEALVRDDRTVLYPILHDIPILLIDQGIALGQLAAAANSK